MAYRGKLKGSAVQTATAVALENEFKEYIKYNERCINNQSALSAFRARKCLQKIKGLLHKRKLELLALYTKDERRLNEYYDNIFSTSIADKSNTKEEPNESN